MYTENGMRCELSFIYDLQNLRMYTENGVRRELDFRYDLQNKIFCV